jgi:MAF protein
MTPASHPPDLVLASASPRRQELLAALGIPFRVQPADVREWLGEGNPAETASALALAKAEAAHRHDPQSLVVAADTVVAADGREIGKPATADEARQLLRLLRGRRHDVWTGLAVVGGAAVRRAVVGTGVWMRRYSDAEIKASIAAGTPFDKAGGYGIQDPLLRPVERWEGCYCNVMGLPLWTLRRLLLEACPALPLRRPSDAYARCRDCPEAASTQ